MLFGFLFRLKSHALAELGFLSLELVVHVLESPDFFFEDLEVLRHHAFFKLFILLAVVREHFEQLFLLVPLQLSLGLEKLDLLFNICGVALNCFVELILNAIAALALLI